MDHSSSLSSRTLWNAAGSLVATVGRVVSAVVIARQLGPDTVGKYAFLVAVAEFMVQFISLGLPSTLTRFMAETTGRGGQAGQAGLLRWVAGRYAALALLGAAALAFGLSGYAMTTNLLLGVFLLSLTTYTLVHAYLSGIQNFRQLAKINFFSGLALVVCQPVGVALFGLDGALIGGIVSSFMSLLALRPIAAAFMKGKLPAGDMPAPSDMRRYALYTWLAALVSAIVWSRTEVFFLSSFGTHAEVGYFNVSLTLYGGVYMLGGLLTGGMTPHFSTLVGSDSREMLQRDYGRFMSMVALFNFPLCIGGAAIMPELLPLIFGKEYVPAIPAATVLMVGGLMCVGWVSNSITYAFGKSNYIFNIALLCAFLMLAGCAAIIPAHGALGGSWVRLGVQAVSTVIGIAIVHVLMKYVPPYLAILKIGLAACMCAVVARLVIVQFPGEALALAAGVAAGALTYLLSLRVLCPIPVGDRDAYVRLASRLPGRAAEYAVPLARWLFALPADPAVVRQGAR